MSISTLPDGKALTRAGAGLRRAVLVLPLFLIAMSLAQPAAAQAARAKRAIEKLEGCSEQERKSGCVAILKVERGNGDKQAVKAQVRGGRIIWYEYDRKSGRVRRTN